jgi:hypothetical protein
MRGFIDACCADFSQHSKYRCEVEEKSPGVDLVLFQDCSRLAVDLHAYDGFFSISLIQQTAQQHTLSYDDRNLAVRYVHKGGDTRSQQIAFMVEAAVICARSLLGAKLDALLPTQSLNIAEIADQFRKMHLAWISRLLGRA